MKTIIRSTNVALLLAAIIALGAAAGFAQDPCGDADGQTKLGDIFRELYPKKDIQGRKDAISAGKQFLEKYGACDSAKELSEYLKTTLPKMETNLAKAEKAARENEIANRFNAALKASNWDEVYKSGKELLAEDADKYRPVVLVLGSIGYDETAKATPVTKWNDETIRFAKMAIADIEAGKTFSSFGVVPFDYANKDNAVAWMNLSIGYILTFDKKNKKEAAPYLYKASQAASDTKTNANTYDAMGSYYFDEAAKLEAEIKTMRADIKDTDAPEVIKTKVDAMNNKIGLLNGTLERAMDAYARAWNTAPNTPAAKAYKDIKMKTIEALYEARFDKKDGVKAWVDAAITKPTPNPSIAVTPIIDPEPTPTTTTSTTAPVTKPETKPAAPATKPAVPGKPGVAAAETAKGPTAVSAAKPATVKRKGTR